MERLVIVILLMVLMGTYAVERKESKDEVEESSIYMDRITL